MKILVIGATGEIGRAVVKELASRHEVVEASRSHAQHRVDLADAASIQNLFETAGTVDAVVCAAGDAHFGPLGTMTMEQFQVGIRGKLLGQIQLTMVAQNLLADRGSITLTSGSLSSDPIVAGANASTVNAGIDGFVRAAAIEMPRGIRINAVSPTILIESLPKYGAYFRGFEAVPVNRAALAYSKSVEGAQTGQIYSVL